MERGHLLSIGIALLVSAGAAFAAESNSSSTTTTTTTTREKPTFSAADTNHDGYISRSEAQQAGLTDYSMADKNADGRLDADEFAAVASSTHSTTSSKSSTSTMSKTPADSSSMQETQQ
jgi:Ca2+-binding EF-hand superfamily protein